jgi:LPXTG-motif cell wall-anchored protein
VMINWRTIWIGVLGIVFVAIGSIVYFKRRSK